MSNVVEFQEWKDRKSVNEVFVESSNTYLFMHDTSEVLYRIDEGEDKNDN